MNPCPIAQAIATLREGQAEAERTLPKWMRNRMEPYREATEMLVADHARLSAEVERLRWVVLGGGKRSEPP